VNTFFFAVSALSVASTPLAGCGSKSTSEPAAASAAPGGTAMGGSIHDLTLKRLDGTSEALRAYAGKVVLVVNTASECGYTPQYQGLQKLHEELGPKGLVVLGFPSNDFGGQEPGSSEQIATFCQKNYGVTFPLFEKVVTKGAGASPLYQLLSESAGPPKWNFHKYLVDKQGRVVRGFPSSVAPESSELRTAIDEQLAR
jgi:glutathione peroxidase